MNIITQKDIEIVDSLIEQGYLCGRLERENDVILWDISSERTMKVSDLYLGVPEPHRENLLVARTNEWHDSNTAFVIYKPLQK